ncbi:phospholipase D/Transphosphatidylase [Stanieria cyanosphaera PCC 7437]|uniref:Phospholipase D/Transphosphatidylase n=1 Tax=Stanieria cyanosphaera (strain ATCC 29371 / PCC 7437) TaxID=111780 RepID=K9XYG4_STAC7|nr:phosphatidylserine/phosphatidylglycerophosphate/cardiolipin synthase family protein [Stanieria cyanosphaera]AFZ36717.1 phospholipase D/Transphosphatidylase [Stanieria cyanosphaera PCC 7437]
MLTVIEIFFWWLTVLFLVVGALLAVGFYFKGAWRDRAEYRIKHPPSPNVSRFPDILATITNSILTTGVVTGFWDKPSVIQQARLEAIGKAKHSIDFETFFMTPGQRANDFATAIAERATAGVKIRLLVDSYGTKKLSRQYWQRLQAIGVEIVFFNPFTWKAPLDYAGRTHRKLLIIDGKFALIGGAGISDLWDGTEKNDDTKPWLDIEMRLEGKIVSLLEGIFVQHWTFGGGVVDLERFVFPSFSVEDQLMIITPGANPSYRFSPIKALKQNGIICARKRIWLASPYFLPDPNSCELLVASKKDGLDVRILTTSDRSDKKPVYYASYEHYGSLLAGGVEIYEYQPSMIHAKMLLIDDLWVVTGSANFDPRSFFHNEELDIMTADPQLVENIKSVFEKGFAQSVRVSLSDWQQRSLWRHRILGNLVNFVQWQL